MLGNEYDKALADLEKVVHLQQQRKGGFGGNASEQEDEGILPGTDSPNAARDGVRSQVNMGVLSLQQKMYARALQQFTAALEGGGCRAAKVPCLIKTRASTPRWSVSCQTH